MMKVIELYIQKYKKFVEQNINLNYHECNELIESIYGDLNITAIIGSNGSGKTTILSMIANIFRYLQRNQNEIPSDFRLVYEINNNIICLEKKNGSIFVKINQNEKKLLLEMSRVNGKSIYSRYNYQSDLDIEDITYEEIKQFLPGKVIVSGFDKEYDIGYHSRLICDRLVKFNTKYYIESSYGLDLSLGIYRVYEKYFSEDKYLKQAFDDIDIHFSEYADIWYTLPFESEFEMYRQIHKDERYFQLKSELIHMLEEKGEQNIEKQLSSILNGAIFEEYIIGDSEDEFSRKFNIRMFLKKDSVNKDILEILIKNKFFYFNDIYMVREVVYPMKYMSTGEKMILGRLFFILNNIENDSILIIEEPEVHLNYLWVKHLISIFILLLKGYSSHLILSSHNYSFINNLFSSQILILYRESVKQPMINTLLADESTIVDMLSEGKIKDNYIEEIIFDIINSYDKNRLRKVFDNMGESYTKVLLFKKLVEIGEIDVESNKRRE
ncbi:hypothetical protein CS538_14665 [Clostridium combesii]|uniref:Endonuclease GajA/Old nuclease/RecF-like AAA domain-containing protein n=2 Tax=Clostridium combesii TaxID=39481 RepID=A0A2G7HDG7_9CLOT|nr:hypothetical protein CS538_14665 [Clostridium combesii]